MLSDFKGDESENSEQDPNQPKAGHDFDLVDSLFLEMMMDGRHKEYSPPLPILPSGIFEIGNLQNNREALHQEDPTKHGQQEFFAQDNSQCGEDTP